MSSLFIHNQTSGDAMHVTFEADGWAIAAVICTVLFVVAVMLIGVSYDNKLVKGSVKILIGFIVLYGAANSVTAFFSSSIVYHKPASSLKVAEHFGLQSGKQYPLLLGGRFAATSGSFNYAESLFYTQSNAQWSPSTGLSIGFQHEGRSYILEFPTSTTTFVQKEGVEPSVALHLKDQQSSFASWDPTDVACDWQWHNFWVVCFKDYSTAQFVIDEETERRGLGPVVLEHFSSATITLNPEMYQSIVTGE